ncbi:hypothetical protein MAQ5080_00374 [Marinomonas aquimarina]|uniref:Uncharacterized protein n=1 Tax=Marinomonas aquimarina TaxID=295068 RepID=A0A1A8T401_9GAMM|nr:hypothetical protein [Marinomonas aquimarina]SBS25813.1 hypothetical protein MAQ5080_00374 [Marinomonas aquimarina]
MITQEQRDELLTLIVGTFGAAPTAEIMQQLEEGIDQGATLEQYSESFLNSQEFADLYESPEAFARQLLGDSISEDALEEASSFLMNSITNGVNVGDLLLTSINAIKNVPEDDPVWSGASKQLTNKKAVAEIFIERTATTSDSDDNQNEGESGEGEEATAVMDFAAMRSVLRSVTNDDSTVAVVREVINSGSQRLFNPEVEVMEIVEELGLEVPGLPEVEVPVEVPGLPEVEVPVEVTPSRPSTPSGESSETSIHDLIADYAEFSGSRAGEIMDAAAAADLQNALDGEDTLDPDTQTEAYDAAVAAYSFDEFDEEIELAEAVEAAYPSALSMLSFDQAATVTSYSMDSSSLVILDGYAEDTVLTDEAVAGLSTAVDTYLAAATTKYSMDGELVLDAEGNLSDNFAAVYSAEGVLSLAGEEADLIGYIRTEISFADGERYPQTDYSYVSYWEGQSDSDITQVEDGQQPSPMGEEYPVDISAPDRIAFTLSEDLNGVLSIGGVEFDVVDGLIPNLSDDSFTYDITGVEELSNPFGGHNFTINGNINVEDNSATPVDLSELAVSFTPALVAGNVLLTEDLLSASDMEALLAQSESDLSDDITLNGTDLALVKELVEAVSSMADDDTVVGFMTVEYVNERLDYIEELDDQTSALDYLIQSLAIGSYDDSLDTSVTDILDLIVARQTLKEAVELDLNNYSNTLESEVDLVAQQIIEERDELTTTVSSYEDNQEHIDQFIAWSDEFYNATAELKESYKDVIYLNVDIDADLEANDELAYNGPADLLVYSPDQASSVINNFAMEDDLYLGTDTVFHVVTAESIAADESFEAPTGEVSSTELVLTWIQHSAESFSSSQVDAFAFSDGGDGYIWVEQAADSVSSAVTADAFNQITLTGVEADSMTMTDGFISLGALPVL